MTKTKKLILTLLLILFIGCVYTVYQIFFGGFTRFDDEVVEIAFSENIASFNPYSFTETNNQRLRNIYEPLLEMDEDLNIKPLLVKSYGQLSSTLLEFTLKQGITFHNGEPLTTSDVTHSFLTAKQSPAMSGLTDSIKTVKAVDDYTFTIETKFEDSLLLTKLSQVFIIPSGYSLEKLEKDPIGTGQFSVKKIFADELHLLAYSNYHGFKPKFEKLILSYVKDQIDRVNLMNSKENLLLVHTVPVGFIDKIDSTKFIVKSTPNNSVNFFVFNFNRPIVKNLSARKLLQQIIDDTTLLRITDNQAKPTDQFVGSGIYGYNPDILTDNFASKEQAIKAAQASGLLGKKITVAVSSDLEIFKEVIEQKFFESGLLPLVSLVDPNDLTKNQKMQEFDLIFMGWKSDFGDAISFFENLVISDAGLNIGRYKNSQVDKLVAQANLTEDSQARRDLLMRAMEIISVEDPFGVPLFEGVNIYGINIKYEYNQRLDGYIDINNFRSL